MLFDQLPERGQVFILTGANGSGKTRWLQHFSKNFLENKKSNRRLICFSGTVMDKFPLARDESENYAYFGMKTNNNMFSDLAPYRRLITYLDSSKNVEKNRGERGRKAGELLVSIGLDPIFKIVFRRGRNSRDKISEPARGGLDLEISLLNLEDVEKIAERASQIRDGLIHASDVIFYKKGNNLEIKDLSSGERSYALLILALAFSVSNHSLVMYDEPENSLHPKWQARIMHDLMDLMVNLSTKSQLIVATHSPLIVSGASNDRTYVLDMASQEGWMHSRMHGNPADVVLKRQFGMRSPRSMSFLNSIQECLNSLLTVEKDPEYFLQSARNLLSNTPQLDSDDPLYQTVEDIRAEMERRQ